MASENRRDQPRDAHAQLLQTINGVKVIVLYLIYDSDPIDSKEREIFVVCPRIFLLRDEVHWQARALE